MNRAQLIKQSKRDRKHGRILCPALDAHTYKPFRVTTPYRKQGSLWSLGYHTGEDHACPIGSLAVATSWGHVVTAGPRGAGYGADFGTIVVVRTRSGLFDYMFCHLSVIKVKVGQKVKPGQVVGLTGATGHVEGAHLHFEARPAGGRFGSDIRTINVKQKGHKL
jgi:murein DD-endopeptidase MepM/ murein hydrolase activator NlpD